MYFFNPLSHLVDGIGVGFKGQIVIIVQSHFRFMEPKIKHNITCNSNRLKSKQF